MNHFFACETGKLCYFLLLLLCSFSVASAQGYEQQRQEKLNGLDLSGLGKTLFLNAGVTSQNEVNYFKNLSRNRIPKNEPVSSEEWTNLYERLMDTDLRPIDERMPDPNKLIETDPGKLTKSNVVPIGIMDLETIYLTDKQITDNEAIKKTGRTVDFSTYNKTRIVYAAALQEDIYQADVLFRVSSELYITNHKHTIQGIAINFNDGQGFKSYPISDRLITYHFASTGEHSIHLRLKTDSTIYLFETKINVRQLERIKPFKEFQITTNKIAKDTANLDQSARTMLVGGEIRIILGCDQILDKAIIIAEGFDIGQNVTLDKIEANYREELDQYLTEGYDLVLLNYNDARAALQDNAQVLKALITEINTMKIGSSKSIVIGESMSGLVARWALREMEVEGKAHNVRLMLCYDTPHQGANIPVGITQILREATPSLLTQVILKFFTRGWRDYYEAMNTPAAKQMMLHWGGHLTGGIGSKNPDFDTFRNQLLALGNGGYPQNCRNIAVINGSMNAGDRELFDDYNYGSRILRSWTPWSLQNTNIDIHTNQLNQNTNVLRFATWGLITKAIGISRSYSSPLNDDFLPGGRSSFAIPNKLFGKGRTFFKFCFVPTFSSIDYQGPRATQADRELLNVTSVNAAETPFGAIYAGEIPNNNSVHVRTSAINWTAIGLAENLLTFIPACPALPIPPTPTISTYNTCYPFSEKRTTEDNTANITVSLAAPSNGQYIHNWTVLPSQQSFTTTGDQIIFQAENPGAYQIICVRTYPNRRDVESTFTTTIIVDDCSNVTVAPENPNPNLVVDPDIDITDIWEGDFLLTTPQPDSLAVFAHYTPDLEILYATLEDDTFVPSTSLITSGMFPEFAALFAETDPRVALPVHLSDFKVRAEGKTGAPTALLTWSTTSEINSDHFEIEKSCIGKDWQKIGIVPTKNLSSEKTDYSYVDQNLASNVIYYRLKIVDSDGTFAYSSIQSVHFDKNFDIAIFPNPVETDKQLQLLLGGNKVSKIIIYDMAGKQVFESHKPVSQIDMHGLPIGKYMARIRLQDGSESTYGFVKR